VLFIFVKMNVQKLYFPVSSTNNRVKVIDDGVNMKVVVDLPDAFMSASTPKWIHVRNVRALHYSNIAHDIKLHGTVVGLAPYDDSYICFCNELLVKPKKYAYNNNNKTLSFWFKDMKGEYVYIDAFVIEIMLEWFP
jgi:hypothetical protein